MTLLRTAVAAVLLTASAAQAALVETPLPFKVGDTDFASVLIHDDAKPASRAILLTPNWMGINEANLKQARLVAEMGYTVYVVDMYGKDVRPANTDEAGKDSRCGQGRYAGDACAHQPGADHAAGADPGAGGSQARRRHRFLLRWHGGAGARAQRRQRGQLPTTKAKRSSALPYLPFTRLRALVMGRRPTKTGATFCRVFAWVVLML